MVADAGRCRLTANHGAALVVSRELGARAVVAPFRGRWLRELFGIFLRNL